MERVDLTVDVAPETELDIVTATKHNALHWHQGTTTWAALCDMVQHPASEKRCGNYVLGTLVPTTVQHTPGEPPCTALHRTKRGIATRSALTLDLDQRANSAADKVELILPCASLLHTTYSSAPDDLRWRLIIPLSRVVQPDEYHALANTVMGMLGREMFDPSTDQPERYMFKPSAQSPDWYVHRQFAGPALDVDKTLAESTWDPDLTDAIDPRVGKNKRDPFGLEGVVGAFNRAYTMDEVIAEYDLPYTSVDATRWSYVGGKGEAGLHLVADGLVYSHHSTDPASGQCCSAFDLVRLHRFGQLDEDVNPQTPINRLPSNAAMLELAAQDPRVLRAQFPDLDDEDAWKMDLQLHPRSGRLLDTIANWDILRANDPVLGALYYNELTLSVEIDRDLPWRTVAQGGPVFGAADRANLKFYIEREYHLRPSTGLIDDQVLVAAGSRYVNPVRDYLEGLEWDGVPRLERCLPGVEDTEYNRLVARKCLVAAVARVMQPGIKWDHTLILFGSEGLGKTTWVSAMARGYDASLGRIGDKDTLLAMHRSWIMVSDEGNTLRKADADAQKEFLTRTADVFRIPYEREATLHQRHCVIWGTTNDQTFLRKQQGNRRFLIVHCTERADFDTLLSPAWVDQVWAEAMVLWQRGERLWLTEPESQLAAEVRDEYEEDDPYIGVTLEYLDHPIPENWDTLSPEARRQWKANYADGFEQAGKGRIMRTCSRQIWCEALDQLGREPRRVDLLEITNTLKALPGWHKLPGRHRLPYYGSQLVFERDSEDS